MFSVAVTVAIALVRDDPTEDLAGWTVTDISYGDSNSQVGHIVIAPAGGSYSPRCGETTSTAELVGTEVVEHAGGAAAGESVDEYAHDAGLQNRLTIRAGEDGQRPCNLYSGWPGGLDEYEKVGGRPADARAFYWGIAVDKAGNAAPLQPRQSPGDSDGGAAAGSERTD